MTRAATMQKQIEGWGLRVRGGVEGNESVRGVVLFRLFFYLKIY